MSNHLYFGTGKNSGGSCKVRGRVSPLLDALVTYFVSVGYWAVFFFFGGTFHCVLQEASSVIVLSYFIFLSFSTVCLLLHHKHIGRFTKVETELAGQHIVCFTIPGLQLITFVLQLLQIVVKCQWLRTGLACSMYSIIHPEPARKKK